MPVRQAELATTADLSTTLAPQRQAVVYQERDRETEEPGVVVQVRPQRRRLDQSALQARENTPWKQIWLS